MVCVKPQSFLMKSILEIITRLHIATDTGNDYHTTEIYKKVLEVALLACLLITISIQELVTTVPHKTTLPMIHCILAVIMNNYVITNNDLKERRRLAFSGISRFTFMSYSCCA